MKKYKVIRVIARLWAGLSLAFILFIVGAHGIEQMNDPTPENGLAFLSLSEAISFYSFLLATLGLALAFKWELRGSLLTLFSLAVFYSQRPDLLLDPIFILLMFPVVLFLVYYYVKPVDK